MTGLTHLAALVVALGSPPAADAPARTPEQLVEDLGSPRFVVRERASRALWELGEAARPALTEALRSPDAEIVRRARDVLVKFDWGVIPGIPPEVSKQIREFRTNIPDRQRAAITELLRLGKPATPTLRTLLARDLPGENRVALFQHLAWSLRHDVPGLILAGELDQAEALLELNALGPSSEGLIDYAVFLHLRDRTGAAAARLEKVRAGGGPAGESAARALVFVYRAAHRADKARATASALEQSGRLNPGPQLGATGPNLYDSLLEDLGAWGELADRPAPRANSADGLRAFRLRLAGRTAAADELLAAQKGAALGSRFNGNGLDEATVALLLNHRPLDGIDRLKTHHNAPHILADMLSARMQFREALALVTSGRIPDDTDPEQPLRHSLYAARRGRLLSQLGERDAAAQLFGRIAESAGGHDGMLLQLVRAEVRSGRYDLACEHFARALAATERNGNRVSSSFSQTPFELIFGTDADAAEYWWQTLRRERPAGEEPGTTMHRVRALLTGTASADDLDQAIRAANRGETPAPESAAGQTRALALAATYRAANKPQEAIAALVESADRQARSQADHVTTRRYAAGSRGWVFGIDERFRFWVELGDLLGEQGRHNDAATRLEQGWKLYPENPVLLYLSGRALVEAGDVREGRRRIELSHWVPLGDSRLRGRFLEELVSRGAATDTRRERDLTREASWVAEANIGNVWNQVARASVVIKDFAAAADANLRAIHYLLCNPNVSYVEGFAYLTVPQGVRSYTARSLLAAGKVDEAIAVARECLKVMPGHTDLVVHMVPELDRLNRKKEADELFQQVWNAYDAVIRSYPNSGWARYSAAWVAAGCRRELDAALAHATKAVQLDPEIKSYQEALAEVHFRRNERKEAVAIMAELAAEDWRNHHYKRQLERYRTGDVASPLPDADEN